MKSYKKIILLIIALTGVLLSKGCKCNKNKLNLPDYSDFNITYRQVSSDEYITCDTISYSYATFYVKNSGADSIKWFINDVLIGINKGSYWGYDIRYYNKRNIKVTAVAYKTICEQNQNNEGKCSLYVQTSTRNFYVDKYYKNFYGRYKGVYNYSPNDSLEINMSQLDTFGMKGTQCQRLYLAESGGNNRIVPFMQNSSPQNINMHTKCEYPLFYGNGDTFVFEGYIGHFVNGGFVKNGKGKVTRDGNIKIECTVYNDGRFTEKEKKIIFTGRRLEKYEYDPFLY